MNGNAPALAAALSLALSIWIGAAARAQDEPGTAAPSPAQTPDAVPGETPDAVPLRARDVLGRALDNRYRLDARASLEIVVTGRSGKRDVRRAEVASKWIDGRLFSIGRFTYPEDMRDLALLRQGRDGRADEFFTYLPEFRRVRRMADPPKADLFLGSDASFEDVERRRLEDYDVEFGEALDHLGEPAWLVRTRPVYDSGYSRVDYLIARSDYAILEQRHFKRGSDEPYKVATAPRAETRSIGGHAVPMRVTLEDHEHGTRTELRVLDVRVDPALDDRLFTVRSLSREDPLPPLR